MHAVIPPSIMLQPSIRGPARKTLQMPTQHLLCLDDFFPALPGARDRSGKSHVAYFDTMVAATFAHFHPFSRLGSKILAAACTHTWKAHSSGVISRGQVAVRGPKCLLCSTAPHALSLLHYSVLQLLTVVPLYIIISASRRNPR